jgi:hypothetical protein
MPPAKKRAPPGSPARGRGRKTSRTMELHPNVGSNASVNEPDAPLILSHMDYDKLASAILRQTQGTEPQFSGSPTNTDAQPQPSRNSQEVPTQEPGPLSSDPPHPQPTTQTSDTTPASPSTAAGLGAVIDAIFLGESTKSQVQKVDQGIVTEGIPLEASISHKTKSKIWAGEFIDFRSLLTSREDPYQLTVSSGVINLHQDPKFKHPISIAQWTDAFLVFAAVYQEKFPAEAPHLLKYCHTIRELQRLHGDTAFRTYDEQFRRLKETRDISWRHSLSELRLKAVTMPKMSPPKTQNQPFRFCFQYNKGQCTRDNCRFKHSCMQCKGNHPKSKCRVLQKTVGQPPKSSHTNQSK